MKMDWMDSTGNAFNAIGSSTQRSKKMWKKSGRLDLPKPPVLLTTSQPQITPLDFDLLVKDLEVLENWCVDLYEYLAQKEGDHR